MAWVTFKLLLQSKWRTSGLPLPLPSSSAKYVVKLAPAALAAAAARALSLSLPSLLLLGLRIVLEKCKAPFIERLAALLL